MSKVEIDNLSKTIARHLTEYATNVEEGLETAKEKISKEAVKTLKATSPKRTGKYAKAWTRTKVGTGWVIHVAAPHYRLAHLLEKGHAKRGGGRVPGRVHIAPVEEKAVKDFESEVERVIRG